MGPIKNEETDVEARLKQSVLSDSVAPIDKELIK